MQDAPSRLLPDETPPPAPGPDAAPQLVAGQRIAEYELLDPIGAGGFSVVWRARDTRSDLVVALRLPLVPEFISHLRREALVASRVQDRNVVRVLEVRLDHEPPFLVMPYIAGANLEVPQEPPRPERIVEALRRFRTIAEIVARLHAEDVVHGDLKPGNIRFEPDGQCYLLDLGLARVNVSTRQASTLRASIHSVTGERIAGTLEYMAPELFSGEKPSKAGDVFSLGVLLHHLLCGRPPAFGVSPRVLNPHLPPGTEELLRQALHPDPWARFRDAGAMLPALDGLIRAEERCLRRRNGHARRLVWQQRMATLARGVRILVGATSAGLILAVAYVLLIRGADSPVLQSLTLALSFGVFFPFACLGLLMGITTINAWLMGIPEKTYKNRPGHRLWSFMMQ